eukprot:gnl/TRDRNA2_/TRDRNA2_181461_c0_seq1.p1 gnl/TRDRNA2_/TRDRNA2_181461_c0~~gnl/TRDRNA2_/TRDRNA2_181461_c0_seq1.p1  ORF type:complete len:507 (+),score=101.96 gnl/TRDRNA2_/TRDRNA2_181461_c0_seq1:88-1608(+)
MSTMRAFAATFALLAFVAHANEASIGDELVSRLSERAQDASALEDGNLDATTLSKTAGLAMPKSRGALTYAQRPPTASRPLSSQVQGFLPNVKANAQKEGSSVKLADMEREAPHLEAEAPVKHVVPEIISPGGKEADAATAADRQAYGFMTLSNQALEQKNFVAGLAFTAAAISIFYPEIADAAQTAAENMVAAQVAAPDVADAAAIATKSIDWGAILSKASTKALGGGKAGALAAVVQVISLMWLRTAMNYQYRYGGDLGSSLKTLMAEGGVKRLYQGLPFALIQGPLSRFGDTATNVGVLALFDALPDAAGIPQPVRTAAASVSAGAFRIFCMPIDTSKTAMQVEGAEGLTRLIDRIKSQGPAPLYQGSIATAVATFAGNYPWFLTYNTLDGYLPPVSKEELLLYLGRSAFLGFTASCVSDTVSNSLRVIKTTQQTAGLGDSSGSDAKDGKSGISIPEALKIVLETDGVKGLFGRGLQTRLLTNAIQGSIFSVLWRYFQTVGAR